MEKPSQKQASQFKRHWQQASSKQQRPVNSAHTIEVEVLVACTGNNASSARLHCNMGNANQFCQTEVWRYSLVVQSPAAARPLSISMSALSRTIFSSISS